MSAPEISVVLPCFDELPNLPELRRRLVAVLESTGRSFELLFVDDGSRDASYEAMAAFAAEDPRIRAVRLSRNFGHQMALTAGVDHARGRLVAVMDADLQDPPELLAEMLAKADEGYEVVYAKRTAREGESAFKKATAHLFYRLMRRWTNVDIPVDTGDFRLLGPRAVERLESYVPPWPLPKIFRLTSGGKLMEDIFAGSPINTPSMLCVADYLDALAWCERVGGVPGTIARSQANLKLVEDFVATHPWIHFLAQTPATRSNTSVCLSTAKSVLFSSDFTRCAWSAYVRLLSGEHC